jgi:hypothetical protein
VAGLANHFAIPATAEAAFAYRKTSPGEENTNKEVFYIPYRGIVYDETVLESIRNLPENARNYNQNGTKSVPNR